VGTFYVYFASKEHLVAAIKARFVEEALDRLAPVAEMAAEGDWAGLLDALVARAVGFLYERRDLVQVFAQEVPGADTDDLFVDAEDRLIAVFAQGIEVAQTAGALNLEDPLATAMLLHHGIVFTVGHLILFGVHSARIVWSPLRRRSCGAAWSLSARSSASQHVATPL